MTKAELIQTVAEATALSKKDVAKAYEAMIDAITGSLNRGDPVILTGFGSFQMRDRPQRMGKNPKTGENMMIAAGRSPRFKAGRTLRNAVNHSE